MSFILVLIKHKDITQILLDLSIKKIMSIYQFLIYIPIIFTKII